MTALVQPSNVAPPAISGTGVVGRTLSASTGTWSGTKPIGFTYQWQRCQPGCADIAGATGSSYTLAGPDTGGGVRVVVLLEGINDIGMSQTRGRLTAPHTNVSAQQIIAGYRHIIRRAHAAGLRIFAGTLTPFRGARYWTPEGEAKREAVNRWILTSGWFDGVIDFARVLADPARLAEMRAAMLRLARPNAAAEIAAGLIELAAA